MFGYSVLSRVWFVSCCWWGRFASCGCGVFCCFLVVCFCCFRVGWLVLFGVVVGGFSSGWSLVVFFFLPVRFGCGFFVGV